MKILQVNTFHYPGKGASSYTFNLTELLRKHGHEIAHFAMQDPKNLPDPNEDLFVPHIDFRKLNERKSPANAARVLGRAIYSRDAGRRFDLLLERFDPDIVHLQSLHAHITPSVVPVARRRSVPVVWTQHDGKLLCPNTHFYNDLTGEICTACRAGHYLPAIHNRCKKGSVLASGVACLEAYVHRLLGFHRRIDAFLCPSRFLADGLLDAGYPSDRVHHLPLFLPETWMAGPSNESRLQTSEPYLLFIGRIEPTKGIAELIAACRRTPGIELKIAGLVEGREAETLLQDLPLNVDYVGFKQGQDLQQLVAGALAVVVPSLLPENQPFSVLEAFAQGKPVIGSRYGGLPELVEDHQTGLLADVRNPLDLARVLNELWIDRDLAQAMGRKARCRVEREFGAERHYEALLAIYDDVLAARTQASRVVTMGTGPETAVSTSPPLKVAYVGIKGVPAHGGAERVVESIARRMPTLGIDPTIYCDTSYTPADPDPDGIQLVRLPSLPGKHLRAISQNLTAALHILCKGDYDLVHLHNVEAGFILPLLRLRYKIVGTSHGKAYRRCKWNNAVKLFLRWLDRPFMRLSNVRTFVSMPDAYEFARRFKTDVIHIPNGATCDMAPDRQASRAHLHQLGLTPGAYFIFVADRIIPTKGAHVAIEAIAGLPGNVPLLILGDVEHLPEYGARLRRQAPRQVIFQEPIRHPQLLFGLLADAVCLIFPSTYEAMSMVLMEASSVGTPVIASDLAENRYVLGDHALYFEASNAGELARQMGWALNHPEELAALSQSSQRHVIAAHSWDSIAEAYVGIYRAVAENKPIHTGTKPTARPPDGRRFDDLIDRDLPV